VPSGTQSNYDEEINVDGERVRIRLNGAVDAKSTEHMVYLLQELQKAVHTNNEKYNKLITQ